MSLAADVSVARPLPPSRAKRNSAFSPSSSHEGALHVNGVLGGLREKSEDELKAADRDALEHALRQAWEDHEQLLERLDELDKGRQALEEERLGLEASVVTLQMRHDQALGEQSRLEADLEGRDELLDRLRSRAAEAERLSRESVKRALEQEKSFEAERQALQAQESHLQQRIRSLMSARPSATTLSDTRTVTDLQEELASLNVSHSTILAQLNTLTKEVHELRATNRTLAEENEGWEFLLRERTLNGKVREGGLLGHRDDEDRYEREGSQLSVLDEEMEMDELHSDLDAQSPILEDDQGFVRDLDQGLLSRSPEGEHLAPPRRKKVKGENLGDLPVTGGGLDLAAELGRAEVDLTGSEMRQLGKGDEGEALRAEVKKLREENKALTLYCSKIIDRIIAQEGFEHILSVDYKTRRMGSRSTSGAGRGSLKDITNAMQEGAPVAKPEQPVKEVVAPIKEEKKARPLSMMVRAMSGTVERSPVPVEGVVEPKVDGKDAKTEKRARRGFSLDFRALGFGTSSTATTPTEPKPNPSLKPLTLPSRTTPVTASSKTILGRRLEKHEEDEEDRRERHHLEATLKLMGVERPSTFSDKSPPKNPPPPSKKLVKPQHRQVEQEETQSLIQPSQPISINSSRKGTPLSRLSSALGSNDSPLSPLSPDLTGLPPHTSPELAAEAALKAFDQREAEQVKALSKGKAMSGYTSPTPGSIRRTSGRRVASGGSTRSSSREAERPVGTEGRGQKIRESGSISTLWSMGSSRPNSQEITPR